MTDVIIEAREFIALDMFKKILKSRLVDFKTSDDTSQNGGVILTSDYFLCSEKFEIEIGGQPKLLEIARKFKAKNIYIVRENSDNFCLESDLGGKYIKLSVPTYSDQLSPQKNYGLQVLASLVSAKNSIIAGDDKSYHLLKIAERVAKADVTVFINGPTGTGKEVISRFVHEKSSRNVGPFVGINCAAIPENMLEAILFGHEKGAFTGASTANKGIFRAADKGTLLLDEISEMPLPLQAKLLRVLQEKIVTPLGSQQSLPVDVRVIATTNRNMEVEITENRFREDLFYRLNVFPLTSINLASRPDDIVPILASLVLKHCNSPTEMPWISDDAINELCNHSWPGNVRELENVIQRALVLCSNKTIEVNDIITDIKLNQYATKELMETSLLKQVAIA
jgi:two-component system response regulator FlrC